MLSEWTPEVGSIRLLNKSLTLVGCLSGMDDDGVSCDMLLFLSTVVHAYNFSFERCLWSAAVSLIGDCKSVE